MLKGIKPLVSILLLACLCACSRAYNYPIAEAVVSNDHTYLKLKGKRELAAHDLGSVFSNKTYEDSILLPVPSLNNGTIAGKDIPVEKGRYSYLGDITIEGNSVKVSLLYNNTDDNKATPTDWNGNYRLINQ